MTTRINLRLNDRIYNEVLNIMDAENEGEPTSKGISRVINYLLVLGIERYYELLKLPPPDIPFNFDKRMGYHDYNAEPSYFERKKKRLIQKLINDGRTYYENFL